MDLLLATHVFLRWDSQGSNLPAAFQAAIESRDNSVYVSAATVWEIAIKRASGKPIFSGSAAKSIAGHGFSSLPVTVEHAERAGWLPSLHRDPFDRLPAAQARLEGLTLVTVDRQILRYEAAHL